MLGISPEHVDEMWRDGSVGHIEFTDEQVGWFLQDPSALKVRVEQNRAKAAEYHAIMSEIWPGYDIMEGGVVPSAECDPRKTLLGRKYIMVSEDNRMMRKVITAGKVDDLNSSLRSYIEKLEFMIKGEWNMDDSDDVEMVEELKNKRNAFSLLLEKLWRDRHGIDSLRAVITELDAWFIKGTYSTEKLESLEEDVAKRANALLFELL